MEETLIALFRHGHTKYRQGNSPCTVTDACDLCMPGDHAYETGQKMAEDHIKANALAVSPLLPKHSFTLILSSNTGRGLHTSKCIREALNDEVTFFDHDHDLGIRPHPSLDEVDGFSWQLFEALYKGGRLELSGDTIDVDPKLTNPQGLGDPDYFYYDIAHRAVKEHRDSLHPALITAVEQTETAKSCADRLMKAIRYATAHVRVRQWIFVTHAGLACHPLRVFTNHKVKDLARGEWLLIRATPESAHVVAAQGLPEYSSSPDLFTCPWTTTLM